MKTYHILSIIALICGITLSSCFDEGICVNADADRVTQSFDMAPFTGVKLATVGKVNLIPGDSLSFDITGSQNIIDLIQLDINGDVLKIDIDRCTRNTDLVFDITLPELTSVAISGSGEIETLAAFEVADIDISISGSGDMDLELTAEKIETHISGSGNMELSGSTDEFASHISGSGDVDAFDLSTKTADLHINGSGNIEVTVTDALTANISGSGDIYYKGTPTVNVEVSGSGSLNDAN
ncbi:MAG: head GIN domain-containing protein [Bacteroidota bacterium]